MRRLGAQPVLALERAGCLFLGANLTGAAAAAAGLLPVAIDDGLPRVATYLGMFPLFAFEFFLELASLRDLFVSIEATL